MTPTEAVQLIKAVGRNDRQIQTVIERVVADASLDRTCAKHQFYRNRLAYFKHRLESAADSDEVARIDQCIKAYEHLLICPFSHSSRGRGEPCELEW